MNRNLTFASWVINYEGGVYNVLSSFAKSFFKSLAKKSKVISSADVLKGVPLNAIIGFNATNADAWQKIMDSNIKNVIWTVDSLFYQNFELYRRFYKHPNFILLNVVPTDSFAIQHYMPGFRKCFYFPHAVDLDFWKHKNVKKENDIVFFGSIVNLEQRMTVIKEKYPQDLLKIVMEMKELSLKNPSNPFWDIYVAANQTYGLELTKEMYHEIFQDIADICETEQRINMIRSLKNFNVKVYGNGPWEKYIDGNVSFQGAVDVKESVEIMNKSKMSLHIQPMKLSGGLHERFLNASAVKTFTLTGDNPTLKQLFGDSFGYFNPINYEDLADKVFDYLKDDDLIAEKSNEAYNIVKNKYTWDNRIDDFINLWEE